MLIKLSFLFLSFSPLFFHLYKRNLWGCRDATVATEKIPLEPDAGNAAEGNKRKVYPLVFPLSFMIVLAIQ